MASGWRRLEVEGVLAPIDWTITVAIELISAMALASCGDAGHLPKKIATKIDNQRIAN